MAKKIVWTESSVIDRLAIYSFWFDHNQSDLYSEKLEKVFNESAKIISLYPEIGSKTDFPELRVKIVRDYKIFYINNPDTIEIIRVWGTQQNPDDLKIDLDR